MNWTALGTSIKLDIDWQFTEPIDGTFFRFKHENYPVNAVYEIAQVELNSDGSYTFFNSQVLAVETGFEDVTKLVSPKIFTQRRLAIRRIPARPTFEQEIRRLLLPKILQSTDVLTAAPARNRWQVTIESSDYVEPSATVDLTPIQTKLDEISTKIDNLRNSRSESSPSTSTNTKTLTYASDGDKNGVCYWIGTNYGTQAWTNPHTAGRITCSIINPYDANRPPEQLVDRQPSDSPATSDVPNSRMRIDLGSDKFLRCSKYSLQGANRTELHLRSWKFKGSKDGVNWDVLDTQNNNTAINQNSWFTQAIATTTYYRYFEIEQTNVSSSGALNIMTLGEFEFYGDFIKQ